jgi:hypothetical protein
MQLSTTLNVVIKLDLMHNASQHLIPARNVDLSSHQPGKLNNSTWPLSESSLAMTIKTSIPRRHQAL